jgi:hypothetical protein
MAARAAASQSLSGPELMGSFHHRMIDIAYRAATRRQHRARLEELQVQTQFLRLRKPLHWAIASTAGG